MGEGRSRELDRVAAHHHKGPQGHRSGRSYAAVAQQGSLDQLVPRIHLNPPKGVIQLM